MQKCIVMTKDEMQLIVKKFCHKYSETPNAIFNLYQRIVFKPALKKPQYIFYIAFFPVLSLFMIYAESFFTIF